MGELRWERLRLVIQWLERQEGGIRASKTGSQRFPASLLIVSKTIAVGELGIIALIPKVPVLIVVRGPG